jgi:hypothetical protein
MNRLRLAKKLPLTFVSTFVLSRPSRRALLSRQSRRRWIGAFNASKEYHVNVSRQLPSLLITARQVLWSLAVLSSSLALTSLIAGCPGSQRLTNDMAGPAAERKMQTSPAAAAVLQRAKFLRPAAPELKLRKRLGRTLPAPDQSSPYRRPTRPS